MENIMQSVDEMERDTDAKAKMVAMLKELFGY